jgi:hypothetical protein
MYPLQIVEVSPHQAKPKRGLKMTMRTLQATHSQSGRRIREHTRSRHLAVLPQIRRYKWLALEARGSVRGRIRAHLNQLKLS